MELERMMRLELTTSGLKACALPLSYTRLYYLSRTAAYARSMTKRTREELTSLTR